MIRLCFYQDWQIRVESLSIPQKFYQNIFPYLWSSCASSVAFRVSVSKCKLVARLVLLLIDSLHRRAIGSSTSRLKLQGVDLEEKPVTEWSVLLFR